MPIKKAAYKELRKAGKKHARNISARSALKTLIKNFERALANKKTDEAKSAIARLISTLDKAASKGIIPKNTAARKISRLMKKLSSSGKA